MSKPKSVEEVLAEAIASYDTAPANLKVRARACVAALEAAGWVHVPKEPVEEMRAAFQGYGVPHLFFRTTVSIGDFDERYRAMLEARPK